MARALDGAPELSQVLDDRWWSLAPIDRRRSVVYLAHGPSSDDDATIWIGDLLQATGDLAGRGGVRRVVKLLRDDAEPGVRQAAVADLRDAISELARVTGDSVSVLPVLVSRGTINDVTIPADLAGLPVRYVPIALAPSPHLARWIERSARETLDGWP